jgi:hypothetical protein
MPDLAYRHGTRVIRVPEGTVSFEIPDQTLADNLNGPVTATGRRYMPKPASCGSKRESRLKATPANAFGMASSVTCCTHSAEWRATWLQAQDLHGAGFDRSASGRSAQSCMAALVPFLKRQRARMLVSIGGDPNSKSSRFPGVMIECGNRRYRRPAHAITFD